MSIKRFDYLFDLYIHQKINPDQERELMTMLVNPANEHIIKERIGLLYNQDSLEQPLSQNKIDLILNNILNTKAGLDPFRIRKIIAVAASLVFMLSLVGFLVYQYNQKKSTSVAADITEEIKAPTQTKAVIVLSEDKSISVEKINADNAMIMDGVQIVKHPNGDIEYKGMSNAPLLNTLENPAGSPTINLTLGDGTRVSLNSDSKLTYPVAFTETERKVTVTGEALFDVAHNANRPFIVQNGKAHIKVLGTTFNIKGHTQSKEVEVTLLKGKVQVSDNKGKHTKTLLPGQQAKVSQTIDIIESANIENAIAWKNETFAFDNQPIEEIAQTLSRWYNVELEFNQNTNIEEPFSGIISRTNSLNETIKMLNAAGVDVKLYNNKIIF